MKSTLPLLLLVFLALLPGAGFAAESRDQKPVPIVRIPPAYPFELKKAGVSGSAEVEFIVETDGSVTPTRVVKATRPEFGLSALASIAKWRFRPGVKEGQPVRTLMTQAMVFNVTVPGGDPAHAHVSVAPPISTSDGLIPPRMLRPAEPAYPAKLIKSRTSGQVFEFRYDNDPTQS